MPAPEIARSTRVIDAPAADIFELLATPSQHSVIDGSGTVQGAQPRGPERLSAGAKFGMQMNWGAKYKILNEVVEFDEGRQIGWRHFGGHVWRYILTSVDDRRTTVTEEFDPTTSRAPIVLRLMRATRRNQVSIEQTLERLQQWATNRS
ncbi:MAG TPA: SRPBCC family protein [Propionibacteriaceae bacterium]